MFTCIHCGRSFEKSVGLSIHLKSCIKNPDRDLQYSDRRKYDLRKQTPHVWTAEDRKRHSERMKRAGAEHPDSFAGHTPNKSCVYNGSVFDSDWEVLVQKYFDKQGITAIRDIRKRFPYKYNGGVHTYLPDFALPKLRIYVEVKGMITPRDLCKWKAFTKKHKLLVLTRKSITAIQRNKCLHLVKSVKKATSPLLFDCNPLSLDAVNITRIRELTKPDKLTWQERSARIKEGIKNSPFVQAKKRLWAKQKKEKIAKQNKSYIGSKNSQYGSRWINNGIVNKKWRVGERMPNGFTFGRLNPTKPAAFV